jgi:multicomponent Na+:H+ antiporter subunit D
MLGWLKRTLTITLDLDWLYRRLGLTLARSLDRRAEAAWDGVLSLAGRVAGRVSSGVQRHHGHDGILARSWPTGAMAFWTTVMLAAYLILSYL